MDGLLSSEYSWEFVTESKCLAQNPCELVYARLVPSAAETDAALYAGNSAQGKLITTMAIASVSDDEFAPSVPIYCAQGLYVYMGTHATGILVIWRNL